MWCSLAFWPGAVLIGNSMAAPQRFMPKTDIMESAEDVARDDGGFVMA
jgi:hypothetical protein